MSKSYKDYKDYEHRHKDFRDEKAEDGEEKSLEKENDKPEIEVKEEKNDKPADKKESIKIRGKVIVVTKDVIIINVEGKGNLSIPYSADYEVKVGDIAEFEI